MELELAVDLVDVLTGGAVWAIGGWLRQKAVALCGPWTFEQKAMSVVFGLFALFVLWVGVIVYMVYGIRHWP